MPAQRAKKGVGRGGPAPTDVFEIEVTLLDTRPPVWRRLLVQGETPLARLHAVLQVAMGWEESHLHMFTVGGTTYSDPEFGLDEYGDMEVGDESECSVAKAFEVGKGRIAYEYDFGDSWEHELRLVKVHPPEGPSGRGPECIAGARACPPEDVGGTPGYEDFLEAMADPSHPRREDFEGWLEGPFDPEKFDLAQVNRELKRLR